MRPNDVSILLLTFEKSFMKSYLLDYCEFT